jgi:hypothetical protein
MVLRTGDLMPCTRRSYIRSKPPNVLGMAITGKESLTRMHECDKILVPSSVKIETSASYPSENNLLQESWTSSET